MSCATIGVRTWYAGYATAYYSQRLFFRCPYLSYKRFFYNIFYSIKKKKNNNKTNLF